MKLTYEEIKRDPFQLKDIIDAVVAGKQIQYKDINNNYDWRDCVMSGSFMQDNRCEYRIKPEPKLRAWKPEEVPVGALLRFTDDDSGKLPSLICDISRSGKVTYLACGSIMTIELSSMVSPGWLHCEHSLDYGKTWLPCGVQET